jgi:branched-chain amino acid transport system ATP-binding protein
MSITGAFTPSRGSRSDVPTGKIVTLIGANGAGKSSTVLRAISGLIKNKKGHRLQSTEITGWTPWNRQEPGDRHAPKGGGFCRT